VRQILNRSTIFFKDFGEMLKNPDRRVTVFIHDIIAMIVALQLSFWLYYGDNLAYFSGHFMQKQMLIFGLLCAGFFLWFQTYRGVWRYVSVTQILILAGAIGFASLLYMPLATKLSVQNIKIHKTLIVMNWAIAVTLATTSRLFYRAFTERWMAPENMDLSAKPTVRLLLVGISRELEGFLTKLRHSGTHNYEILGIVTDNTMHTGRYLQGYQVLGTLDDLPDLIENYNADGEHPHQLVIASTQYFGQKLQQILKLVHELKVDIYKLPNLDRDQSHTLELQPLILEDFFEFPNYKSLQDEWSTVFKSEKIVIIGSSTLLGKQLIRLLLLIGVDNLVLCDSNHLALAELKDELAGFEHDSELHFVLTHLYDEKKYNHLLTHYKPTMVIYLDGIYEDDVTEANPLETLAENTLTTTLVMDLAAKKKIDQFVYVAQSQFSHESNIGQLSLKLAEAYCQSIDKDQKATRFVPIKLAPTISSDSEFIYKLKQLFEHRLQLELNSSNQLYSLITPAAAALSVLKTIYIAQQNDQIRGKSFSEVISEQMMLSYFIELVARLENISLEDMGGVEFLAPSTTQKRLEYQQKESLYADNNNYELLSYNVPLKTLATVFKDLRNAIDSFDQDKALSTIKKLTATTNSRSARATHGPKGK
jgi:O-antigen biosynthesis protein WbqV